MISDIPETTSPTESPFGEIIHLYSRKQALADGYQVDVSTTAAEAGLRLPTFLTRAVFDQYVAVPAGVQAQDESGRLWDIVFMLAWHLRQRKPDSPIATFKLYVRNDNKRPQLVTLKALCGPRDHDDPQPSITIMLTSED